MKDIVRIWLKIANYEPLRFRVVTFMANLCSSSKSLNIKRFLGLTLILWLFLRCARSSKCNHFLGHSICASGQFAVTVIILYMFILVRVVMTSVIHLRHNRSIRCKYSRAIFITHPSNNSLLFFLWDSYIYSSNFLVIL